MRPGDRVLDVGCGAGEGARALARIVRPDGLVVAIDAGSHMIVEASRRGDGLGFPVEYRVGDRRVGGRRRTRGTLVVDGCDAATTRAVLTAIAGGIRDPWMGRRLFGLFRRAGLAEVAVVAGATVLTDLTEADRLFRFSEGATRAQACGAVTAAAHWTHSLESEERRDGGRVLLRHHRLRRLRPAPILGRLSPRLTVT